MAKLVLPPAKGVCEKCLQDSKQTATNINFRIFNPAAGIKGLNLVRLCWSGFPAEVKGSEASGHEPSLEGQFCIAEVLGNAERR